MDSIMAININNKNTDISVKLNMSDVSEIKYHVIDALTNSDVCAADFKVPGQTIKQIFGDKKSENVLVAAARYLIGDYAPQGEGTVDIVVKCSDGKIKTFRLYDSAPVEPQEPFMGVLRQLEGFIKNPAIDFSNKAKAGVFNDMSDKDYAKALSVVRAKSKFFGDKPESTFANILIIYAETFLICNGAELPCIEADYISNLISKVNEIELESYRNRIKLAEQHYRNLSSNIKNVYDAYERAYWPNINNKEKKQRKMAFKKQFADMCNSIIRDADKPYREIIGCEDEETDLIKLLDDTNDESQNVSVTGSVKQGLEHLFEEAMTDSTNQLIGKQADVMRFLQQVSFTAFYNEINEYVIGHDKELKKACYYVYSYLRAIATTTNDFMSMPRNNFIITGRSGCGKTEFCRALKRVFKKHGFSYGVVFVNATALSPEGYKGTNVSQVFIDAYMKDKDGYNIIFFDEMDKILVGSGHSKDWNAERNSNLLTILDGDGVILEINDNLGKRTVTYPTDKALFIGLGAFADLRENKTQSGTNVGFTAPDVSEMVKKYTGAITADDITEFGASHEFVGRFCDIINFTDLNDDDIIKILNLKLYTEFIKPKSVPVKNIEISEAATKKLLDIANGKRGVRAMVGKVKDIVSENILKLWEESGENALLDITINDIDPVDVTVNSSNKREIPFDDSSSDSSFGKDAVTF